MYGYNDMTYCTFWKECKNGNGCFRALTPKVQEDAVKLWEGHDVPIDTFLDKPECFEQIEDED